MTQNVSYDNLINLCQHLWQKASVFSKEFKIAFI